MPDFQSGSVIGQLVPNSWRKFKPNRSFDTLGILQEFYKRVHFKWPNPHSTEVPRTNSCMKPTIRKFLLEQSHQKNPIRTIPSEKYLQNPSKRLQLGHEKNLTYLLTYLLFDFVHLCKHNGVGLILM